MRGATSTRLLLWAIAIAVVIGLAVGWFARIAWTRDTPESRARDAVEGIRDRVRELTR